MARIPISEILQYLKDSRQHYANLVDNPFFDYAEPSVELLRNTLRQRFQELPYPYPAGRKTRRTFLEKLRSKGVLEALLSDQVLERIGVEIGMFELELRERDLKGTQQSAHGLSFAFHSSLLSELYRHVKNVQAIRAKYKVETTWASSHIHSTNGLIRKELEAIYPLYPSVESLHGAAKIPPSWHGLVMGVHQAVSETMERAGLKRGGKTLANQLTSIILAPAPFLNVTSSITPEAVRVLIGRAPKRSQKIRTKSVPEPL